MKLEEDLIRHMVLNSIRGYNRKFKQEYGKIVICCDNKHYWRREVFPLYKANRKRDRDASNLNWGLIFECLGKIKNELREFFPYQVLDIEGAEADDIIGTLTKKCALAGEKVLVLSSDKDFTQLQKYPGVKQFSPIMNKFLTSDNPKGYILEHIIRGDRGDGIPNFLSPDDTFVSGARQKVINTKKLNLWLTQEPEKFCTTETLLRNYKRNQMLVDLDYIPQEITARIITAHETTKTASKRLLLDYFIEKRLKNLLEVIDEF